MEEPVWRCEEPEATVSLHCQSIQAPRSCCYAPYQSGLSLFPFSFLFTSQKKSILIENLLKNKKSFNLDS
jgi:hypothetical protein